MKFNIPTIGTMLKLSHKWTFALYDEYRNSKLWESWIKQNPNPKYLIKPPNKNLYGDSGKAIQVSLPKGTILNLSRIYIRQGKKEFDSITFSIKECPEKYKGRFWVKLDDANKIQYVEADMQLDDDDKDFNDDKLELDLD